MGPREKPQSEHWAAWDLEKPEKSARWPLAEAIESHDLWVARPGQEAPVIEFLTNYALFALKLLTVFLLLAGLVALIGSLWGAQHGPKDGQLVVTRVGERLQEDQLVLAEATTDEAQFRLQQKARKSQLKAEAKARKRAAKKSQGELPAEQQREKFIVLDFRGDLQASAVSGLRREITAILGAEEKPGEVVVRLESGGGLVHSYGLAASQLRRIVDAGIRLTVCVDKVAASGGYMMACVANHLVAAPFAIVGSIGVIAQIPNFHRLLDKHAIDFELVTAGKYKRTLTVFGENTEQGRDKFQQEIEETHQLFQTFVRQQRPQVDLERVATGEVWFGQAALQQELVDEVLTSDEYLGKAAEHADVFELHYEPRKNLQDRLTGSVESAVERLLMRAWEQAQAATWFRS